MTNPNDDNFDDLLGGLDETPAPAAAPSDETTGDPELDAALAVANENPEARKPRTRKTQKPKPEEAPAASETPAESEGPSEAEKELEELRARLYAAENLVESQRSEIAGKDAQLELLADTARNEVQEQAMTAQKIASDAITVSKINVGKITGVKLASGTIPAIEDEGPSEGDIVQIHFLDDGFNALGKIMYRGQALVFTVGDAAWKQTLDRKGRSWVTLDVGEQFEKWGKQYFAPGPWPGLAGSKIPKGMTDPQEIADYRAAQIAEQKRDKTARPFISPVTIR